MKKTKLSIFGLVALLIFGILIATPASAVKPTANLAAAEEVAWHLSADIASVPPYGCADIPGSDTSSKLIVNQPNGNTEVALTGVMNGLHPNTEYTVYIGNGYSMNAKRWNIVGDWKLRFVIGGNYDHDMTVCVQDAPVCGVGNNFDGTGSYPAGAISPSTTWVVDGVVNGQPNPLDFYIDYDGSTYVVHAIGTISPATGTMTGSWTSNTGQSGTWSSLEGVATYTPVTSGFPGYGTKLGSFTFITNEFGEGSWHVNLQDADFANLGTRDLSVWINSGGRTILISDNFPVIVG